MTDHFTEKLISCAAALGLQLSTGQAYQLYKYYEMLIEKNKVMNLTAITEEDEVINKHFIDSLSIIRCLDPSYFSSSEGEKNNRLRIIDIGTGAGFPGMVLKVVFPDTEMTLFDSQNKRLLFLNEVIKELGTK